MGEDRYGGTGGGRPAEARTDPLLPKITDELLEPGRPPVVPTLDDRSLAELLAELDGDDEYARHELRAADLDAPPTPKPPPAPDRPAEPAPDRPAEPAPDRALNRATEPDRVSDRPAEPAPDRPSDPDHRTRPGPDPTPTGLPVRESGAGPVLRSAYGDFRPPVDRTDHPADPEPPDAPSLTGLGLTRRTWSKRGSRLFTVVFVAIFVLILIQTVISMLSSAGTP